MRACLLLAIPQEGPDENFAAAANETRDAINRHPYT